MRRGHFPAPAAKTVSVMTNYYNGSPQGNALSRIPPVTRSLLIINIGIWIACFISGAFGRFAVDRLGLHFWSAADFNPIQLVTYMFVHDIHNFAHIFFNMFALYMFGRMLEMVWGQKKFLFFYLICGVGAGLVQEVVWQITWQQEYIEALASQNGFAAGYVKEMVDYTVAQGDPARLANMALFKTQLCTIGASGAIFGLLVGFGFVFPNVPMYLFFIPVPIKAKWIVIGYGLLEILFGASGALSSVAHYAHLGGMLFGLLLVWLWKPKKVY